MEEIRALESKDALIAYIRKEYDPRAPGSATRKGMLYQEIPFEGYEAIQAQRRGSDARLRALLGAVDVRGKHVLDVGCNIGFFCFSLAREGARCWGLDADRDALRVAESLRRLHGVGSVRFTAGRLDPETLQALCRDAGHFDIVLLNSVIHWLLRDTGSIRTVQSWLARIPASPRGPQWFVYEPSSTRKAWCPEELREPNVRRFLHGLGATRVERIAREYVTNARTHRDYWLGEKDLEGLADELDRALGDGGDLAALERTGARVVHRKRDKVGIRHRGLFVKTVIPRGSPMNAFLANEAATARGLADHPELAPVLVAELHRPGRVILLYEHLEGEPLRPDQTPRDVVWMERELRRLGDVLRERRIVHNDIRWGNLLVDRARQELRLIDYEFSQRDVRPGGPAPERKTYRPFPPGTPEEAALLDRLLPVLQAGGPGRGTGTPEGDRAELLELIRVLRVRARPAWRLVLRRLVHRRR